ncbi:tyrosine-type recombinase/integrase [Chryseobacterium lineare]
MEIQYFLPAKGESADLRVVVRDAEGKVHFRFRTYLRIDPHEWDSDRQRPINIYLKRNKMINHKLDNIRMCLLDILSIKRKRPVSHRRLARIVKDLSLEKEHVYTPDTFMSYMHEYIASRRALICHSTYKRYMVFFRLMGRFQGKLCRRLQVNEINYEFVREFIDFGKQERYSENTIYRSIHFVKTILNYLERQGMRTKVRELDIRRDGLRREMITFSDDEIRSIEECEVPDELLSAKKWLLISCYTGQRVSDFMKFTSEKLIEVKGITCVSFMQKKTRKEITLPMHPAVVEIIRENGGEFPEEIRDAVYNRQIKEIARLAGLHNKVKAKKRVFHRLATVIKEKWELITSHIGRRSFATNFYGKIPTSLLMEATGHSTEQMFLRYINPMDNSKVVSLSGYFDQAYEMSKGPVLM